jgi:hypothetical protein
MAAETAASDPLERRVPVGRFTRYKDAKRAVDRLCVARIPEQRITVLGRGITWNPPLNAERSAVLGARVGSAAGALTLLLLWSLGSLAATFSWLSAMLAGGFVGAIVGAVAALLIWRVSRDRSVLPESGHVDVRRYDVLVEPDDLPKARNLLER